MYNAKIIIQKQEVINPITYSMIPVNLCQMNKYLIIFNTDDMISKFEAYEDHKMDTLYLT